MWNSQNNFVASNSFIRLLCHSLFSFTPLHVCSNIYILTYMPDLLPLSLESRSMIFPLQQQVGLKKLFSQRLSSLPPLIFLQGQLYWEAHALKLLIIKNYYCKEQEQFLRESLHEKIKLKKNVHTPKMENHLWEKHLHVDTRLLPGHPHLLLWLDSQ